MCSNPFKKINKDSTESLTKIKNLFFNNRILSVPSFLPPLQPAASWHLLQHPAGSRSCDSAPSPPPITHGQGQKGDIDYVMTVMSAWHNGVNV